jgi:predicted S18 family serine protease
MRLRIIFFSLMLIYLVSACSGEISHDLVAVVGDGGNMVTVTIRLVPGSGNEYIRLLPYAGISTQQSIKMGLEYSRYKSDSEYSDCDVLVDFGPLPYGEYIDGPSAGIAIAVMSYALFENLTIRDDTLMTGSVDSYGTVGSVGGLYEKARAAVANDARYFITPYNTIYESLTLDRLEELYGIKIIEVKTVDEAIDFMIYNITVPERNYTVYETRLSENVTPIDYSKTLPLRDTALKMIEIENQTLDWMPSSQGWIKDYFSDAVSEQIEINNRGYYFTAANDAFLNYVEVSTINAILEDYVNLEGKKNEVVSCLESRERPVMTDENFEWVLASDLRRMWAVNKVNSTAVSGNMLVEGEYAAYHELMYADAWCRVSGMLGDVASGFDGTEVDEAAWKQLAERKIAEAEETQHTPETASRLAIAKKSYEEGYYGAAIYDAVYVTSMDDVDIDLLLYTSDELEEATEYLSEEDRDSVWGQIYHSQGVFFMNENSPSISTSYRLFVYAKNLDYVTEEMRDEMETIVADKKDEVPLELLVLIFLFFSFVLLYILPKRRSYAGRNKRRGDISGTGKKVSGAGAKKGVSGTRRPKHG